MKLNIVLAEPQIPQNTGNIARTCAVTGAALHIIKPMGFEPTDKQLKRAGLDYWHFLDITYYDGFDDFFAKTKGDCFYFTTKAQTRYTDVNYPDNCFIVFGREGRGTARRASVQQQKFLRENTDDADAAKLEFIEQRGDSGIRDFEAVGFSRASK